MQRKSLGLETWELPSSWGAVIVWTWVNSNSEVWSAYLQNGENSPSSFKVLVLKVGLSVSLLSQSPDSGWQYLPSPHVFMKPRKWTRDFRLWLPSVRWGPPQLWCEFAKQEMHHAGSRELSSENRTRLQRLHLPVYLNFCLLFMRQ